MKKLYKNIPIIDVGVARKNRIIDYQLYDTSKLKIFFRKNNIRKSKIKYIKYFRIGNQYYIYLTDGNFYCIPSDIFYIMNFDKNIKYLEKYKKKRGII